MRDLLQAAGCPSVNQLRIASTAVDAETITVGTQVFEIDADGVVTAGRTPIDISGDATAGVGTLTVDGIPTNNDTVTIGATVYTYKTAPAASYELALGADAEEAIDNLVEAINGDLFGTDAHPDVTAAKATAATMTVTAKVPGVAGNSIATTETFTEAGSVWDAVVLENGADPSAAEIRAAIVTAFNGNGLFADNLVGEYIVVHLTGPPGEVLTTTETLAGTNNAWIAAATYGGRGAEGDHAVPVQGARTVLAAEATSTAFIMAFGSPVLSAVAQVRDTDGKPKAWDGKLTIDGQSVLMLSDGSADLATGDVVTVQATLDLPSR
jgi:hypothetical protein